MATGQWKRDLAVPFAEAEEALEIPEPKVLVVDYSPSTTDHKANYALGMQIAREEDGKLVVTKVVAGGQAFIGGIEVGDVITRMAEVSFTVGSGKTDQDAVELLTSFKERLTDLKIEFNRPELASAKQPSAVSSVQAPNKAGLNAVSSGETVTAIVLEGGGVKGIAYAGALKALFEHGLVQQVKMFAGVGAGATSAAMLALGFNAEEFQTAATETPWKKLLDSSGTIQTNVNRLLGRFGYYKSNALEEYLNGLFEAKSGEKHITFRQVYQIYSNWLRIPVTNLSTREVKWLDYKTCPDMPIAKACRISSSMPLIFAPTLENGEWLVDGSFISNLPMRCFKSEMTAGGVTLALNLASDAGIDEKQKAVRQQTEDACCLCCNSQLPGFVSLLLGALYDNAEANDNDDLADWCHVVNIPTGNVQATNFKLKPEDIAFLVKSGNDSLRDYCTGRERDWRVSPAREASEPASISA